MQNYERVITLKTIYLTLVRRTEMILLFFLPLFLASYIVTNHVMAKTYTSSTVINNGGSAINQATYSAMGLALKTGSIFEKTEDALADSGLKHSDGSAITVSEISSGLSFSTFVSNMVAFTVSFSSSDNTIVQSVLKEYSTVALESVSETYPNLAIYSAATEATKTSSENKYFFVGVAASLVLALGIPFVFEILADEVFDADDIQMLGAPGFEIKMSGK